MENSSIDANKKAFYDRLDQDLSSEWAQLEGEFYRNTHMGDLELNNLFHESDKRPVFK